MNTAEQVTSDQFEVGNFGDGLAVKLFPSGMVYPIGPELSPKAKADIHAAGAWETVARLLGDLTGRMTEAEPETDESKRIFDKIALKNNERLQAFSKINPIELRPLSDNENARYGAEALQGFIAHNTERGRLAFDDETGTWIPGDKAFTEAARGVGKLRQDSLVRIPTDSREWKANVRHAEQANRGSGINAVAALMTTDPRISIPFDAFDPEPWINCRGQAVNLQSGETRPARPEDRFTKSTAVPLGAHPSKLFLDTILSLFSGEQDLSGAFLRFLGYSLTPSTIEQTAAIVYGPGRTGKTAPTDAVLKALGDYGTAVPSGTFAAGRKPDAATNDLAALARGPHLGILSELESDAWLDETRFKQFVSAEACQVRFLHKEFFTVRPRAKLLFVTNHLPRLHNPEDAIFRRWLMFPVRRILGREEMDRRLPARLEAEGPGILRVLVDEAGAWYREGLLRPASTELALREYSEAEDRVARFIAELCTVDEFAKVPSSKLYRAYRTFVQDDGGQPEGQPKFGRTLEGKGYRKAHENIGSVWRGLRLNE